MTDLDDLASLGLKGIRTKALRWNALDGLWRIESVTRDGEPTLDPVPADAVWVVDMLTRERGAGITGDARFEMYLTPVGSPPPSLPDDPDLKPAVSMLVWVESYGMARITTCSAVARTAIARFWEVCKSYAEASDGLIPSVEFGPGREVSFGKNNARVFWAPTFNITGWVDREKIWHPALWPATVAPPARANLQIAFDSDSRQAIPHTRRSKPAVRALPDDEIPF